jgi:hypothetical protein
MATRSKKKTASKPSRLTKKATAKQKKSTRKVHTAETIYATKPDTKGSSMTEAHAANTTSAIEQLLADISAKLTELVQIETYLANRALDTSKPTPAAVAAPNAAAPSAVSPVAPAATPPPATPSRPGAGTIGGLVYDYCDGLNQQLGRAPTKDELLQAIRQYSPTVNGQPVNELTVATQYSKWRGSQGLPKLPRGFAAGKQNASAKAPQSTPPSIPTPSAPTIGAQPGSLPPTAQPGAQVPPFAMPAAVAPAAPPAVSPIPAAAVPSVIAPTAVPAASIPPWLRSQQG